jgi:hypothetical protein
MRGSDKLPESAIGTREFIRRLRVPVFSQGARLTTPILTNCMRCVCVCVWCNAFLLIFAIENRTSWALRSRRTGQHQAIHVESRRWRQGHISESKGASEINRIIGERGDLWLECRKRNCHTTSQRTIFSGSSIITRPTSSLTGVYIEPRLE